MAEPFDQGTYVWRYKVGRAPPHYPGFTIDAEKYLDAWSAAFPGGTFISGYGPPRAYDQPNADFAVGGNPAIFPFLCGPRRRPDPNEAGRKDTIKSLPGEVTRIVVRWAPQDVPVHAATAGVNLYPFDPTEGPGYIWHRHILDHEDNDMMRPYSLTWVNRGASSPLGYSAASATSTGSGSVPVQGCSAMSNRTPSGP